MLAKAEITLPENEGLYAALAPLCTEDSRVTLCREKGRIILRGEEMSKHAAHPDGSINAAMLLADVLLKSGVLPESDRQQLTALQSLMAHWDGRGFPGLPASDPEFGPTTIANGMVRLENGRLRVAFDVRYVNSDHEEMLRCIRATLDEADWEMDVARNSPGFKYPADDPMLQTLLSAYSECTGQENPPSHVNAGGTYARCLPNAFAVGTELGGQVPFALPGGHGGVHQPDEVMHIDGHLRGIAILAMMILRLDEQLQAG